MEEVRLQGITLDTATLEYALRGTVERLADLFFINPADIQLLEKLNTAVSLARSMPFEVNLWKPQNRYYEVLKRAYPDFQSEAEGGDENARAWIRHFVSLGENLSIRVG